MLPAPSPREAEDLLARVAEHYRKAERCLPRERRIVVIVDHNQNDIEERSGLVKNAPEIWIAMGPPSAVSGRSSVPEE